MNGMHIKATGRYVPEKVVTNDDLSRMVDTSDEWIRTRTGICERHFLAEGETHFEMLTAAARDAITRAGISKEDIGAVVVATLTAEYKTPSTACRIQAELGLPDGIPCFDINAACSGFLYGLQMGKSMLDFVKAPYVLLVSGEALTRITDMTDRSTCVLFGDGAGAMILERSDAHRFEAVLGARGNTELLSCPDGGTLSMAGQDVFRFAVETIPKCIDEVLQKASLTLEDIDYVVCHQANARIIQYVIRKLKAPEEKFYMNVANYGNTSAGSIPIALDEMAKAGMLSAGKRVICVGFGSGLTWGGALLEW